jgi:hypothetical protein
VPDANDEVNENYEGEVPDVDHDEAHDAEASDVDTW